MRGGGGEIVSSLRHVMTHVSAASVVARVGRRLKVAVAAAEKVALLLMHMLLLVLLDVVEVLRREELLRRGVIVVECSGRVKNHVDYSNQ